MTSAWAEAESVGVIRRGADDRGVDRGIEEPRAVVDPIGTTRTSASSSNSRPSPAAAASTSPVGPPSWATRCPTSSRTLGGNSRLHRLAGEHIAPVRVPHDAAGLRQVPQQLGDEEWVPIRLAVDLGRQSSGVGLELLAGASSHQRDHVLLARPGRLDGAHLLEVAQLPECCSRVFQASARRWCTSRSGECGPRPRARRRGATGPAWTRRPGAGPRTRSRPVLRPRRSPAGR